MVSAPPTELSSPNVGGLYFVNIFVQGCQSEFFQLLTFIARNEAQVVFIQKPEPLGHLTNIFMPGSMLKSMVGLATCARLFSIHLEEEVLSIIVYKILFFLK